MGHGFTIKPYISWPKYDQLTCKWAEPKRHTSAEAAGWVIEVDDDITYIQYAANGNKTNTEVLKAGGVVGSPYGATKTLSPTAATTQTTTSGAVINSTTATPTTAYWIEVQYLDENNQPVANLPFTITDSTGKKTTKKLNADGFAHVENLSAGTVSIDFLVDYDKKVKKALNQLNEMLKEALLHAHQETKRLQKEWDKTHWMDKPVILAGSLAVGIGDAIHELALSIVHLLQDFQKLLMGTGDWLGRYTAYHEQLHRAWDKGDIDGVKRAVAALDAMENELDAEIDNGIESGKLIANLAIEPSLYKAIIVFSYDYINALHITKAVEVFPTVALNVALLLVGGAGAAKQGIKGAEKIAAHLKQSADLFKRKKYKKTLTDEPVNTKVEIKPDGATASKIQLVNGKLPRNSMFAGKNYSLDVDKNPILKKRVAAMKPRERRIREMRLKALAKKYPEGVNFTDKAFPNFKPYVLKHKGKPAEVKLKRLNPDLPEGTKGREQDMIDANSEMLKRDPNWIQPKDYTWHHVENSTKLELVPRDLHSTVGHTGSRTTNNI